MAFTLLLASSANAISAGADPVLPQADLVEFSVPRAFHDEPFELELATATSGATIRFTRNAEAPTATSGEVYAGPIPISRTTVFRAAAFKPEHQPGPVATRTFLFLEDAIRQPARPDGFPTRWGSVGADYGMDPRITEHPAYAARMREALLSLPTLSVVAANDSLFSSDRGVYANPQQHGDDWERPASVEWIDPDGGIELQTDCGLRIQGGWFRQPNATRKHSFRVLFKQQYGTGKLRHDVFGEFGAAREFDTLVLRAGANDGYAWDAAKDTEQFLRDEFGRRLQLALGHPAPRGRFFHLYLNGLYWGLYNLTERPNEDFSATYFGGEPEEWDAINSGEIKSGDLEAWNETLGLTRRANGFEDYLALQGRAPDGSRDPRLPVLLDARNYIDYMILNIWGGNWDWPNKNFWFGRRRTPESDGFKFYVWDFENTMGNNRSRSPLNMVAPRSGVESAWVGEPHSRLRRLTEYQIDFADRVQRALFNAGPLEPARLVEAYRPLADLVESAVVAESARWGDDHHNPPQDPGDWLRERDWLLGTYLPQRTAIVLDQFRSAGLFPRTEAPRFSQHGGSLAPDTALTIQTSGSGLYFTTDGADPRLPGGAPNPNAVHVVFSEDAFPALDPFLVRSGAVWRFLDDGSDPGPGWRAPGLDDTAWASGPSPLGYGDGDERTVTGFIDSDPDTDGVQKNAATFFRHAFDLENVGGIESLRLTLTYDDAGAAFLNGHEVLRTPNLPSDATFETYATDQAPDNSVLTADGLPAALLRAGSNVVAVEIHQRNPSSSDISFDLELEAHLAGAGAPHTTSPLVLERSGWVRARARNGTEWSPLTEAYFTFDTEPANTANLVVSEVCYHPPEPVAPAEQAVSINRDDYEFIELLNAGPRAVALEGVSLGGGVHFEFASGTQLDPGERALVVRDREAFAARYGKGLNVAGEYQGRLNNAGEEILLQAANGEVIQRFVYDDSAPWPAAADGDGFSLVLIAPESKPDPSVAANWRASVELGGNPGASDASRFAGRPDADLDANGRADFADYALGTKLVPTAPPMRATITTSGDAGAPQRRLTIVLTRNLAADDARIRFLAADNPAGPWTSADHLVTLGDATRLEAGVVQTACHLDLPVEDADAKFVQVQIRPRAE